MSSIPPSSPTPATGTVTVTKFQRAKGWFGKRNFAVKLLLGLLLLAIFLAFLGGFIALCYVILSWAFAQTVAFFSNDTEPTARPTYVASSPAPTPTVPDPTATAASPTATDTITAAPSPSASPCYIPSEPNRKLAITQKISATDVSAYTAWLSQLKGTGFSRIVYAGEPVSADALRVWMNAAACNGFVAEIHPHKISDGGAVTQTAVGLFCWDIWAPNHKTHCSASNYLPIFLPDEEPNLYGKVADYAEVGKAATSGWAAVQGHSWTDTAKVTDDPLYKQFVEDKKFPDSPPPTTEEITHFAQLLVAQGVTSILYYVEDPAAQNTEKLARDGRALRQILGN